MAINTNTLVNDARCISKCVSAGMEMPVLIALFAKLLNMPINTNALMEQAKCVVGCVPQGMMMPVLIGLVANATGGGGGGGGGFGGTQVYEYTGASPTSDGIVPTSPASPAIAYHRAGLNPLFTWNVATQAWI